MKKLLCFILIMVFGMSSAAFAANEEKTTISLNEGESTQIEMLYVPEYSGHWEFTVDNQCDDTIKLKIIKDSPTGEAVSDSMITFAGESKTFSCKPGQELTDKVYYITITTSGNYNLKGKIHYRFVNTENSNVKLSVEGKVKNLIELGIVEGDPDGNLRLDENITRAEFTKVICKALNAAPAPTSVAPYFSDVDANFWAFGYIETARRYGLIKGYGDDLYHPTFKPYNNITYSESFKMIVEMLGYGLFAEDLGGFPDGYKTVALQDLELFRAFVPDYSAPITRGELFEIVYNALDVPIVEVYDRANRNFKIMNGAYDDTPLKTLRMALENRQQKMKG